MSLTSLLVLFIKELKKIKFPHALGSTETRSPDLICFTSVPVEATTPQNSCPGVNGRS